MRHFTDILDKLHSLELYEDAILLLELIPIEQTALNLKDKDAVNMAAIAADCYYQCDKFGNSQESFYKAITLAKSLPEKTENLKFDEAELKFRLHRCLLKQNKREEAVGVLASIPEHLMTPKMKSAMARLHVATNIGDLKKSMNQTVANSLLYHKKVVEECPEAIDSLSHVLRNGLTLPSSIRWGVTIQAWLNAQTAIADKNFIKGISTLTSVSANSLRIIILLGLLNYKMGEREKAAICLQRAHHLDANCSYAMDILAYIFAQDLKYRELENLATKLMESHESPEAWVAYGLLARSQKKLEQAIFFAEKACRMCKPQAQPTAMLLKAIISIEQQKWDEGIHILRDALIFDPDNFDIHNALVRAYLSRKKLQEARVVANAYQQHMGSENARAIYLNATISAADPENLNEAQKLLEKAISSSPNLLDAVFLLVELYDRTQHYEKAINLLKKQAENTVNSRLHRLLGDFLSKTNRPIDACYQYRLAVDGDPDTAKAMNSLDKITGMATPVGLASAICPGAPRRRGNDTTFDRSL